MKQNMITTGCINNRFGAICPTSQKGACLSLHGNILPPLRSSLHTNSLSQTVSSITGRNIQLCHFRGNLPQKPYITFDTLFRIKIPNRVTQGLQIIFSIENHPCHTLSFHCMHDMCNFHKRYSVPAFYHIPGSQVLLQY